MQFPFLDLIITSILYIVRCRTSVGVSPSLEVYSLCLHVSSAVLVHVARSEAYVNTRHEQPEKYDTTNMTKDCSFRE